jgi:hypothetical protein
MMKNMNKPRRNGNDKFCKFCYDAGKKGWNTHLFRNEQDQIICPYLLEEVKCGYCKAIGHTTKYCPKILKNNNPKKTYSLTPPLSTIPAQQQPIMKTHKNSYGALVAIMEEDQRKEEHQQRKEEDQQRKEEDRRQQYPPILATASQRFPSKAGLKNWATIASKPKAEDKPKAVLDKPQADDKPKAEDKPPAVSVAPSLPFSLPPSWGDMMDEEDELARIEEEYLLHSMEIIREEDDDN